MPTTPLTCPELYKLLKMTEGDIGVFKKLREEMILQPEKFEELVAVYRGIHKNWMQLKCNGNEEKEKAWVKEATGAEEVGEKDINGWRGYEKEEHWQSLETTGKTLFYHEVYSIFYHLERDEQCDEKFNWIGEYSDSNGWRDVGTLNGKWTWYHPEKEKYCDHEFEVGDDDFEPNKLCSNGWWEVLDPNSYEFYYYNPSTGEMRDDKPEEAS